MNNDFQVIWLFHHERYFKKRIRTLEGEKEVIRVPELFNWMELKDIPIILMKQEYQIANETENQDHTIFFRLCLTPCLEGSSLNNFYFEIQSMSKEELLNSKTSLV